MNETYTSFCKHTDDLKHKKSEHNEKKSSFHIHCLATLTLFLYKEQEITSQLHCNSSSKDLPLFLADLTYIQ